MAAFDSFFEDSDVEFLSAYWKGVRVPCDDIIDLRLPAEFRRGDF